MSAAISFTGGSNSPDNAISFAAGSNSPDKDGVVGTLAIPAGDLKLRASTTTPSVVVSPSFLSDLSLSFSFSLEKPGSFLVDFDLPTKDVRFQFMNSVNVLDKQLNLIYTHARRSNQTAVDASLALDPANKVWGSYVFGSGDCKLKYSYVLGGVRTFEPCYDVSRNSWDVSLSQRIFDGDVIRAFYRTSSKVLELELLSQGTSSDGRFKISATMNLAEGLKVPKLSAESTWNFEM